jgi:ribosome recycling factor
MEKTIETLDGELGGLRTGRASPALVERLEVTYYGTTMPLNQLATIATPEPRQITIRPWDQKSIQAIEKAILASDLGMTPSNDGTAIRLVVPRLTEERREELIKIASRRVEEARVAIRNVRRDFLHHLEKDELPEDEEHRLKERIQQMTDEFVREAERHGERKAAEIREV